MKAVILAGGYGKRLRPLTDNIPKSLLPVAGRPILEWQIRWLAEHGVRDVIICIGYLKEKIIESVGSGQRLGVRVGYVVEDEPLGTGGALKNAEHLLREEERFYVLNGDVLTNINPTLLVDHLGGSIGAVAVIPLPSPYGIVGFGEDLRIREFREKPVIDGYWINAGIYAFTPEVFSYLPDRGDMEKTAFPKLSSAGMLTAVPFRGTLWKSIDSHKDLEEVEAFLSAGSV